MKKKRFGDRKDGYRIHDGDPMHVLFPYLLPNRTDNEVCLTEKIDLAPIAEYIKNKNVDCEDFSCTVFHVVMAALAKVFHERPCLNRFYIGNRLYERDNISFAFAAKKEYTDDCPETIAIVRYNSEIEKSPMDQIYNGVKEVVNGIRVDGKTEDGATGVMKVVGHFPRCIIKLIVGTLNLLDYYGLYPKSLMDVDPYYTTCFISNLGSIRLNADYHHLVNRGTNSIFVIIGKKEKEYFTDRSGNPTYREYIPVSITLDERIADGVYFSKSLSKLRKYLAHPEELDIVMTECQEKDAVTESEKIPV